MKAPFRSSTVLSRLALALVTLLAVGAPAAAQDSTWSYKMQDVVGKNDPAVMILFPNRDVQNVVLELSAGKLRQVIKRASLPGNEEHRVQWRTPPGLTHWHARLTARAGGPPISMEFDFDVAAVDPLEVREDRGATDLLAGKVGLRANRQLKSAEVQVFTKTGEMIADTTVDLSSQGGQPIIIDWQKPAPDIRRVDLKLTDHYGLWRSIRMAGWYEIPHEDVIFETGKWDIRESEVPKLEKAMVEVEKELENYKNELGAETHVDAALYVAGHTDTVGPPAENQVLSDKRARSIAEYFKKHGVKVPVYFQGAGEHGLAVETGDNVDEARNRRAAYMLSGGPPGTAAYSVGGWRKP